VTTNTVHAKTLRNKNSGRKLLYNDNTFFPAYFKQAQEKLAIFGDYLGNRKKKSLKNSNIEIREIWMIGVLRKSQVHIAYFLCLFSIQEP